jgi:hypothetical protein
MEKLFATSTADCQKQETEKVTHLYSYLFDKKRNIIDKKFLNQNKLN